MSDVIELFPFNERCVSVGDVHLCAGKLKVLLSKRGHHVALALYDDKQNAGFYKAFTTRGELERFIGTLLDLAE